MACGAVRRPAVFIPTCPTDLFGGGCLLRLSLPAPAPSVEPAPSVAPSLSISTRRLPGWFTDTGRQHRSSHQPPLWQCAPVSSPGLGLRPLVRRPSTPASTCMPLATGLALPVSPERRRRRPTLLPFVNRCRLRCHAPPDQFARLPAAQQPSIDPSARR